MSSTSTLAPPETPVSRGLTPKDAAALRDRVQSLRLDSTVRAGGPNTRLPWAISLVLAASTAYFALRHNAGAPPVTPSSDKAVTATTSQGETTGSGTPPAELTSASPPNGSGTPAEAGKVALESKGYIIPAHQILVSPKVSGMLVSLNIEEGRRVTKGDVLAQIETTEYDAELERAKANLALAERRLEELVNGSRNEEKEQARADFGEAEKNVATLRSAWERAKKLREKRTISDNDYDQAESSFLMAEFRLQRLRSTLDLVLAGPRREKIDQARAEVSLAKADLLKAQWRHDNTTVRAPITGTILKKNAEEGNIVNPVAFNGSYSLCDMADLADLEVDLSIQERDIARVFKGQRCDVTADAYPGRKYDGFVDRLMPIADRAKGAVSVRVKVRVPKEEEGVFLKPDMAALVRFYGTIDSK